MTNKLSACRKIFTGVAVSTALLLGPVMVAPAANADVITFNASSQSGTVGVPMNLYATSDSSLMGGSVTFSVNGQSIGTATLVGGQAVLSWTPTMAGTFTLSAFDGYTTMNLTNFQISPVSTITTITAPSVVALGNPTPIQINVIPVSPSAFQPQGTVMLYTSGGAPVASANLVAQANSARSSATISWTPQTLGVTGGYAVFTPSLQSNGVAGSIGSTSPTDNITVTQNGSNLLLTLPPQLSQNVPATLVATSTPGTTGTVTFSVNNTVIGTVPMNNGTASISWTPTVAGPVTIRANSVSTAGNNIAEETITIVTTTQADTIQMSVNGTPVPAGKTGTMRNGSQIVITGVTLSGANIDLNINSGACTLNGSFLTARSGSGACSVTATSLGGNGWTPATASYTIFLNPGVQVPSKNVPASGTINKGRTIVLEPSNSTGTNAGQNIKWRVSSKNCTLQFPTDGAVTLRGVKKGTCRVTGTAPAVKGQWAAMNFKRTYTVR